MNGGGNQVLPTGNVGFLITDIEGSTALYRRLGSGFEALLERHRDICRVAFVAHGGVEVACAGDGFIVAFEHAADALAAAVDAQRALTAEPWPVGDEIRVRMGVHVGEARVTSTGGTYLGFGLHEASRVGDAGSGGQVIVSEAARQLVDGQAAQDIELVPLGSHRLRGLDETFELFEVRAPGLDEGFPPLRTSSVTAGNLGPSSFELIGRSEQLAHVIASLDQHRLMSLVGPGGVGKTRLAIAAAHGHTRRFRDGCWFVDLSALPEGADANRVAGAIGAAVSVEASHGVTGLASAIGGRDLLLVMDNCEHLLRGAGEAIGALLAAGPQIQILATSQAALSLRDEHVMRVEPLAPTDAAALFVRRATDVAPDVAVTPDEPAVVHICEQLDGLPLAIELAANRVRMLSTRDIAARLENRFALLRGGATDSDERHRTLSAAIEWSHELLESSERRLLRRLAVFRGGAELTSIEAICVDEDLPVDEVFEALTALLNRSLITVDRTGDVVRYGMLRSIYAYAHQQLRDAGELDVMRSRHLQHFSERSWDTLWAMHRGTLTDELRRFAHEADNIRAAIAWSVEAGAVQEGLRLACGAGFFGRECIGGYVYASREWILDLLQRGAADDDAALRCQAHVSLASVSVAEGDWARVLVDGEAALALVEAEQLGDELRAQALGMVGVAAEQAHPLREAAAFNRALLNQEPDATAVPSREPTDAIGLLTEAAELAKREGLAGFRVVVLTNLASAALQIGEALLAREAAERALAEARSIGFEGGTARALNRLVYVAMSEGDFPSAAGYGAEAMIAADGSGATGELAATHTVLASLCVFRGDFDGARQHAYRARDLFAALGHWVPAVRLWATGATVFYSLGLLDLAREAMEELIAALVLVGDHPAVPVMLVTLVPLARSAGHDDLVEQLRPFVGEAAASA